MSSQAGGRRLSSQTFWFITTFVLSRIGDTVFLVGLPLYIFQVQGGRLLGSTYVNLAIVSTVLLGRGLILSVNAGNPILVSGLGELAMVAIEIVMLGAIMAFGPNIWMLIGFVVLLALTYNLYAPAKFYRLQDHFFPERRFFWTTLLSTLASVGVLVGVGLSGVILSRFGIEGLILFDAATFLIFGLHMLACRNLPHVAEKEGPAEEGTNTDALPLAEGFPRTALMLLAFATLMNAWDQSLGIAAIGSASLVGIGHISLLRASLGLVGLLIALWASHAFSRETCGRIFSAAAVGSALALVAGSIFPILLSGGACYLMLGVTTGLAVAVRRDFLKTIERKGHSFVLLNSRYWVYSTVVCFSIPVVAVIGDAYSGSPRMSLLAMGSALSVFGVAGGYCIAEIVLRKAKT